MQLVEKAPARVEDTANEQGSAGVDRRFRGTTYVRPEPLAWHAFRRKTCLVHDLLLARVEGSWCRKARSHWLFQRRMLLEAAASLEFRAEYQNAWIETDVRPTTT